MAPRRARPDHRHHRPGWLVSRRTPAAQGIRGPRHDPPRLDVQHVTDQPPLHRPARRRRPTVPALRRPQRQCAAERAARRDPSGRDLPSRRPVARPGVVRGARTTPATRPAWAPSGCWRRSGRCGSTVASTRPRRSEMYGGTPPPQNETTAVLSSLAVRRGEALRLLADPQLSRGLRHVRGQRDPLQPRVAAPWRDVRDPQDLPGCCARSSWATSTRCTSATSTPSATGVRTRVRRGHVAHAPGRRPERLCARHRPRMHRAGVRQVGIRIRRTRLGAVTCDSTSATCGRPRSTRSSATPRRAAEQLGWRATVREQDLAQLMVDADLARLKAGDGPWIDTPEARHVDEPERRRRRRRIASGRRGSCADVGRHASSRWGRCRARKQRIRTLAEQLAPGAGAPGSSATRSTTTRTTASPASSYRPGSACSISAVETAPAPATPAEPRRRRRLQRRNASRRRVDAIPTSTSCSATSRTLHVLEQLDGPFDFILLSDTIGSLDDVQATLANLHRLCHPETRLVISYYNRLWAPVLRVGQWLGLQMPQREQNWLSGRDIANILDAGRLRRRPARLAPAATAPGVRTRSHRQPLRRHAARDSAPPRCAATSSPDRFALDRSDAPSATIVVPCRNEAGNVAAAVERTPRFCDDLEFIFVEGHSSDDTFEAVERVIAEAPRRRHQARAAGRRGQGRRRSQGLRARPRRRADDPRRRPHDTPRGPAQVLLGDRRPDVASS